MKKGTLYEARRTWEVRSHMLDLAGSHKKYEQSDWKCQACDQQDPRVNWFNIERATKTFPIIKVVKVLQTANLSNQ